MSGLLTPGEKVAAGRALADVHSWAASAWRRLGAGEPPATYASVLADFAEIIKRVDEVRVLLSIAELPSVTGQFTGTGWV